jgi:hypothetical protein
MHVRFKVSGNLKYLTAWGNGAKKYCRFCNILRDSSYYYIHT